MSATAPLCTYAHLQGLDTVDSVCAPVLPTRQTTISFVRDEFPSLALVKDSQLTFYKNGVRISDRPGTWEAFAASATVETTIGIKVVDEPSNNSQGPKPAGELAKAADNGRITFEIVYRSSSPDSARASAHEVSCPPTMRLRRVFAHCASVLKRDVSDLEFSFDGRPLLDGQQRCAEIGIGAGARVLATDKAGSSTRSTFAGTSDGPGLADHISPFVPSNQQMTASGSLMQGTPIVKKRKQLRVEEGGTGSSTVAQGTSQHRHPSDIGPNPAATASEIDDSDISQDVPLHPRPTSAANSPPKSTRADMTADDASIGRARRSPTISSSPPPRWDATDASDADSRPPPAAHTTPRPPIRKKRLAVFSEDEDEIAPAPSLKQSHAASVDDDTDDEDFPVNVPNPAPRKQRRAANASDADDDDLVPGPPPTKPSSGSSSVDRQSRLSSRSRQTRKGAAAGGDVRRVEARGMRNIKGFKTFLKQDVLDFLRSPATARAMDDESDG